MIYATIWRDLRWRLIVPALLLAACVTLTQLSFEGHLHVTVAGAVPASASVARGYIHYLDIAWFQLPGASALFLVIAVLIAAGGRLTRPSSDLAYLFALPISRRRWVMSHIGASVAAVATLLLLLDVLLVIDALRSAQEIALGALLVRSAGVLAAASVWVCIGVAALALTRYAVLAMVLVFGALALLPGGRFRLELPAKESARMLSTWDPWAFADPRAWRGTVPVESLLVAIGLGLGATMLAIWLVERREV